MVSRGLRPGLLGSEAPNPNHYYSKCSKKEPSKLTGHPISQLRKLRLKEEIDPSHSAAAAAAAHSYWGLTYQVFSVQHHMPISQLP